MKASKSFVYRCDNDEDVTMTYLSGSVGAVTGCRTDQLLNNRELSYGSLCHPDDLKDMIDAVDASIEARTSWDLDYRLVRPDGSELLVRERGAAVFNDAGDVIYLQGLVVDASAENELRIRLEEKAQTANSANVAILSLANQIVGSVRELNMLSVNSKIEAARAGDSGAGFKVIAGEIQRLAKANADCAVQIAEQMSDMMEDP